MAPKSEPTRPRSPAPENARDGGARATHVAPAARGVHGSDDTGDAGDIGDAGNTGDAGDTGDFDVVGATRPPPRARRLLPFLAIAVLAFVAYANTLHHPFV